MSGSSRTTGRRRPARTTVRTTALGWTLAAAVLSACASEAETPAADPAAVPAPAATGDAAASTPVASAAANGAATGVRDTAAGEVSGTSAAAPAPGDTARKIVGTLLPGRSKQDQETFNAAIRMGERQLATWPKTVAGAPPARCCRRTASSPTTAIRTRRRWA